VHAATIAPRHDLRAKEALLRYVLRPALAQERVTLSADGSVRLGLKRAFSDGTVAAWLAPLSFMCRLAAAILGPGFHTVRYGGILSSAAKWRPLVVPEPSEPTARPSPAADGQYVFQTESDDGVRLWVNKQLVIDNLTEHNPTTNDSPALTLPR
jgi:hypothetical protein